MVGCAILAIAGADAAQTFHPDIPRAWDDKEVVRLEAPLAQRDRSPRYLTAEQYYALKVRPIYRTHPTYAAGREPAGYMEALKQKEPEIVFDASKIRTKEDWIRASEAVFDAATRPEPVGPDGFRLPPGLIAPVTSEGIIPYRRYVVRQKGVVEQGVSNCTLCHARVLPDGTALKGAPLDVEFERSPRKASDKPDRAPKWVDGCATRSGSFLALRGLRRARSSRG